MKRDRPKRKEDLRDEKPSVVGVTESSNLFNGGDVFLATTKSLGESDWILDSGDLFHMYSVREYSTMRKRYY